MATAPTDSLYPPLSAALIRRAARREPFAAVRSPLAEPSERAADARFFTMSLAGSFVFFITWLG
ncbi:MAG: hypothetical protein ABR601_11165 [Parasphingopyxis sp.]